MKPPTHVTVDAGICEGNTMITKFDSSYYGTVEMENLGYAGTPINERRYQGHSGHQEFSPAVVSRASPELQ